MEIVIIEDERFTADDLAETIVRIQPDIQIATILYSVKEAIRYFQNNEHPDLIFSDVQLGDGLSFEIFKTITMTPPVIFCTAYDEYALHAFKANGIDYILKPYGEDTIAAAFGRYKALQNNFVQQPKGFELLSELFSNRISQHDPSVLVYIKDKIVPFKTSDIALFYTEDETTYLMTFNQTRYPLNKTLEELEKITGINFYRANRQYLVNRKSIKDVTQWFHRKLVVNLVIPFSTDKQITISKAKVSEFLNWLSGEISKPLS
jgi:two-component system, LytTR family, response regulator LytT